MWVIEGIRELFKWCNDNQGVVSVAIFIATLAFGWLSGIFAALRRRAKFKIDLIPGPTFSCTFQVGKIHAEHEVHRTAFALYLKVANVGSAASSIEQISIGYHWHLKPLSWNWVKYSVGWHWLHNQAAALADFQVAIGDNIKFFPFLTQRSVMSGAETTTFLEPGRSINGVVYFEQSDSWGGCFPSSRDGKVQVIIRIRDVLGSAHSAKFKVPMVPLQEARKYNPKFALTLAELNGEELPFDRACEEGAAKAEG